MKTRITAAAVLLLVGAAVLAACSREPGSLPSPGARSIPTVEDAHRAGVSSPENVQFWRTTKNGSDNSLFVLIHSVDPNTRQVQTYATEAHLLLGAIHREHDLPYTEVGSKAAERIALETTGRIFRFRSEAAGQNIPKYYSDAVVAEVRSALGPLARRRLLTGFAVGGQLHVIYSLHPHPEGHGYEYAVAQVLLEKGLIASMHNQITVTE